MKEHNLKKGRLLALFMCSLLAIIMIVAWAVISANEVNATEEEDPDAYSLTFTLGTKTFKENSGANFGPSVGLGIDGNYDYLRLCLGYTGTVTACSSDCLDIKYDSTASAYSSKYKAYRTGKFEGTKYLYVTAGGKEYTINVTCDEPEHTVRGVMDGVKKYYKENANNVPYQFPYAFGNLTGNSPTSAQGDFYKDFGQTNGVKFYVSAKDTVINLHDHTVYRNNTGDALFTYKYSLAEPSSVTIKNGEIKDANNVISLDDMATGTDMTLELNNLKVDINGTIFPYPTGSSQNASYSVVIKNGCMINGSFDTQQGTVSFTTTLYDGYYSSITNATIADGYEAITLADIPVAERTDKDTEAINYGCVYKVQKQKVYVAQIGTTKYESLSDALAAAQAGNTIKLLANVTVDSNIAIDKQLKIDGQSQYSITASDSFADKQVILGTTGANLTLKNVTVNANNKSRVIRMNTGVLTIDGATITGGTTSSYIAGVYMTGDSQLVMSSGSITGNTTTGDHADDYLANATDLWIGSQAKGSITGGSVGKAFVNSNSYETEPNGLTLDGGTVDTVFVEWDGDKKATFNYTSGTCNKVIVAADSAGTHTYFTTYNSPTVGTTYEAAEVASITCGDPAVTTYYATLEDAVTAANSGDTITMLADVELSQGIDLAKNVTLDLNGKAISAVATGWTSNSTDGTDGKCDYIFGIRRGGKLTVNDSSTNKTGAINAGINTEEKVGAAIKMTIYGDGATGTAAELVVNGGTITGYKYAITGNGSRHNTTITINDGILTAAASGDGIGIFNPQDGNLTINGGTITAYSSAIEVRAGELEINGGVLTATADTYSVTPNANGSTTVGAAIAIAQHTTKKDIDVKITGGRFAGVKTISEADPQGNNPDNITMSITGGRFNGGVTLEDVTKCISGGIYKEKPDASYVAEDMAAKTNSDDSTVGDYGYMIGDAERIIITASSTLEVGGVKKSTTVATITGGGQYKAGNKVTLKATAVDANSIFTFDGWYVNGTKIENAGAEYTFTAEADAEYVANFTTSSTQEITTTVSKTGDEAAVAAGTVTVKAGTEAGSSSTTKQIGTEVELTATAGTNTYFICWENTDGNVVSTSPTFTATPVQTQTISAVFYDEAAARVSFNDDSGALLKAQMYKESEAGEVTDVVAPAKRGQEFKGWSGTDGTVMTDKEVASAIKTAATEAGEEVKAGHKSSALGIVNVQAVYEKATTYKIIIHSIDSDGTTVCRDLEATATYGESHVVTASLTCGNKTLVGFSKTDSETDIFTNSASFTISPDEDDVTNGKVEYYAIYGEAPASRIAALSLGKFFDGSTNVHMLAATMSWSLPEGATLVEAGFYYSTSGEEDLNQCNNKYTTTLTDTSGSYTVYMNLQGYESYDMYMRAFVTYKDKDGTNTHTVVNGVEGSDSGAEVTADNPISGFGYVQKCWNDVKPAE